MATKTVGDRTIKKPNLAEKVLFLYIDKLVKKSLDEAITQKDCVISSVPYDSGHLFENCQPDDDGLILPFSKMFRFRIIFYMSICIISRTFSLSQPLVISQLLKSLSSKESKWKAYGYSSLFLFVQIISKVGERFAMFNLIKYGIKLRLFASSTLYRKLLNSRFKRQEDNSVVVNLICNEASRLEKTYSSITCIALAPFVVVYACLCVFWFTSSSGLIGICFLLTIALSTPIIGHFSKRIRLTTSAITDKRIRFLAELVNSIDVVKMSALETRIVKIIEKLRRKEVVMFGFLHVLLAVIPSLQKTLANIAILMVIKLMLAKSENFPSSSNVYGTLSAFSKVQSSLLDECYFGLMDAFALRAFVIRSSKILRNPSIARNEASCLILTKEMVKLDSVIAQWVNNSSYYFDLIVDEGEFVVVTGTSGSGKTTLMLTILNETEKTQGNVYLNGRVSYASQEPWIFAGTVRANITFGREYDNLRYQRVLRICCLEKDLRAMRKRDYTIIGEGAQNLSGGQRSRIALARAIYHQADIYLLDDCLSSMDPITCSSIFRNCIRGFLREKTVIMTTNRLDHVQPATNICIIQNSVLREIGSFSNVTNRRVLAHKFGGNLDGEHRNTQNDCMCDLRSRPFSREMAELVDLNELDEKFEGENKSREINCDLVIKYFSIGSRNLWVALFVFSACFAIQLCPIYADVILSKWLRKSESPNSDDRPNDNVYMKKLSVLIALTCGLCIGRTVIIRFICLNFSRKIHEEALIRISGTTVDFFKGNRIGLSGDNQKFFIEMSATFVFMARTLPIAFSVILIFGGFVTFYKHRYDRLSRQLYKLEASARARIVTELNSTINGLVTIRAQDLTVAVIEVFESQLNVHAAVVSTIFASQKWYQLRFEIGSAIVFFLYSSYLITFHGIDESKAGLLLSYALSGIRSFQVTTRLWTDTINMFISVSKMMELLSAPPESNPLNEAFISSNWPSNGTLVMESASFRFSPSSKFILSGITFGVSSGKKVAIVGRTGAGKSTLLKMIYRLGVVEGSILLDEVDLSLINVQRLRRNLCIIPQNPVFFTGTLRENLDPFSEAGSDEVIWLALEKVGMKSVVREQYSFDGLDLTVSGDNHQFSHGQFQLLSICRAIIRNKKLVLIDEATSFIDNCTDILIQKTIRSAFAESTVITIAHRINTIMDYDAVIVIQDGKLVEYGHPQSLLKDPKSKFGIMARMSGIIRRMSGRKDI